MVYQNENKINQSKFCHYLLTYFCTSQYKVFIEDLSCIECYCTLIATPSFKTFHINKAHVHMTHVGIVISHTCLVKTPIMYNLFCRIAKSACHPVEQMMFEHVRLLTLVIWQNVLMYHSVQGSIFLKFLSNQLAPNFWFLGATTWNLEARAALFC